MKNKIILYLVLLVNICSISQNKKFSLEINYPLTLRDGEGDKTQGVLGGSLKYRFKTTTQFNLGVDYTFDFLNGTDRFGGTDLKNNSYFHHLNFFGELNSEPFHKIHPTFGLGFTIFSHNNEYIYSDPDTSLILDSKRNNLGINFKIGINYEITKNFFAQTYFHYIRTFEEGIGSENKTFGFNHNQLKLGLGYKF